MWRKIKVIFFSESRPSSSATDTVVRILPKKSRKRCALDIFDTFAAHAGLIYNITDADHCAQNGSTQGLIFINFQMSVCKNRAQIQMKSCCVHVFYSISIERALALIELYVVAWTQSTNEQLTRILCMWCFSHLIPL